MDTNIGVQATTECMKATSHFGSTTYVNVCTGKSTEVVWGGMDWVAAIGVTIFVGLLIALLGYFVKTVKDNS